MAPSMTWILALSVQDEIEKYGAYAGFGAVVGLAVLSLLYFAQAREVKRLREWAGRSPERAAELQERVQAEAQRRVVQPSAVRPGPAPAAGAPVAPLPATPAGQVAAPGVGVPASAAAAATAAGAATAGKAVAATATDQPTSVQPGVPSVTPANGLAPKPGQPLILPPAVATGGPGGPSTPAGAARASAAPEPESSSGGRRPVLPILGAVAALAVVAVVAVLLLTGGDDSSPTAQRTATTSAPVASSGDGTTTPKRTTAVAAKPSTYTVSVLNGTAVPGLARGVATRLENAGWSKIGTVTNASDQTRTTTLVEYAKGREREARAVAKSIDVGADAIKPLSVASRTIAGDEAVIVVTVGRDQYTSPQQ